MRSCMKLLPTEAALASTIQTNLTTLLMESLKSIGIDMTSVTNIPAEDYYDLKINLRSIIHDIMKPLHNHEFTNRDTAPQEFQTVVLEALDNVEDSDAKTAFKRLLENHLHHIDPSSPLMKNHRSFHLSPIDKSTVEISNALGMLSRKIPCASPANTVNQFSLFSRNTTPTSNLSASSSLSTDSDAFSRSTNSNFFKDLDPHQSNALFSPLKKPERIPTFN